MTNFTLAMVLGGWKLQLLLVLALLFFLAVAGAIAYAVIRGVRFMGTAARFATDKMNAGKNPPPPIPRKCPQCHTELKPDVPEGLCPACLLKHGIATEPGTGASQPPFVPPDLAELARLFPQLEIIEAIGKGGMGAVYKARQPALDRVVALKILAPKGPAGDLDFAGRFTREARALARLNHPNIVAVYDFGQVQTDSGRAELPLGQDAQQRVPTPALHYFIMEYVDGPNLRQVQQAGRLAPREALQIIPQICAALQFAHDEGIVHRDIKPENVLLDKKGRVKIADFGLAKILGAESQDFRLTGARDIMGTPHYMAPEQVEKPQEVDHRADIYSLGVVFYEMLTGELPLGKFQSPSAKVQMDVRLDEVVLRSLEKEPARRYQHVSEMQTQVETIAASPQSSKSEIRNPKSEMDQSLPAPAGTKPRFSRTAIAGACWVAIFPFVLITFYWLYTMASTPRIVSNRGVFAVLALPFLLLSITAPLGATLFGWIAVSQIRRSAGRLCGLGLAVLDGLLFPLLALDTLLIAFGVILMSNLLPQPSGPWKVITPSPAGFWFLLLVLLAGAIIVALDFLIIRGAWRAVNQPLKSVPGPSSVSQGEETNGLDARNWLGVGQTFALHAALLLVLSVILVKVVPTFADIFAGFGVKLPWGTLLVISLSNIFRHGWPLLVPLLLALDFGGCVLAQRFGGDHGRKLWSVAVVLGLLLALALLAATIGMTYSEDLPRAVANREKRAGPVPAEIDASGNPPSDTPLVVPGQDLEADSVSNFKSNLPASRADAPISLAYENLTIELSAVGCPAFTNQPWWRPNGQPTTNDFSEVSGFGIRQLPARAMREPLPGNVSRPSARPAPNAVPTASKSLPAPPGDIPQPPGYPGASVPLPPGYSDTSVPLPPGYRGASEAQPYQFIFRLAGPVRGVPHVLLDGQSVSPRSRTFFMPERYPARPAAVETLWVCEADLPSSKSAINGSISLPAGPWLVDHPIPGFETGKRVTSKILAGGLIWNVAVRVEQTTNGIRLTGSHPIHWSEGWEQDLVLLAGNGRPYSYSTNEDALNHGAITLNELNQTYANLSLEDVHEIRFRLRPYQWFTFRNISLRPGQFTTVEAVLAPPQPQPPVSIQDGTDSATKTNRPPLPEASAAPATPPPGTLSELEKRFAAAQAILAFPDRDEALAAIALDTAKAGDAALTKKVLSKMTAFPERDEATRDAARELVKQGLRAEALEIARTITAFPTRDAALRELAE